MQSLAEMTTYLPVQGASVPTYINRFFEPSLAFAAGWNYRYAYAVLVAAEISAASLVIDYWENPVYVLVSFPSSPQLTTRQTYRSLDHYYPRHHRPSEHLRGQSVRRVGILICVNKDDCYIGAHHRRGRATLWWRT